ncbi:MAG: hypothetical protein HFG97_01340 [Dorea sp.]|nr:hypothetical protein [Dorea sp.]
MSMESNLVQKYNGEKVAVYGLGIEAEKALPRLKEQFQVIGLLDSFQENGTLYGMDILSFSQAVDLGTKLIIVVARPGSCKAIARRIGDACRKNAIALMDIRGKNLLERKSVVYNFTKAKGDSKEELYQKIAWAEVVSFDLFDTLIMREVLSSTDVIKLLEATLEKKGIHINNFASKRIGAEKRLSKYGAPTLEELYEDILDRAGNISISASELAQLEWKLDFGTIVARKAVCEVYEYCLRQQKAVYIVTDTYYRQEQIREILDKYHLVGYAGLLVSCECRMGKTQGLFSRLKDSAGERKCLHIGDDLIADMEMAKKEGMDIYHIFSGEELLDTVGSMGMEEYMGSLTERLKVGLFTARLFNDPFQFETEERRIEIRDAYDIGYLICAPMITDFMFWFRGRVRQHGIKNIWFGARDGYLPQKLYRMLEEEADTIYFQTSRTVAIRTGMMNDADIAYIDSMKFSGTLEESLKVRFGLEIGANRCDEKLGLFAYRDRILRRAAEERRKYSAYIGHLSMKEGDIVFFDFVAKGTIQMYVQRLISSQMKGLYFLRLEPDFMSDKGLDIDSFYKIDEAESNSIYDNYYVLETILTAPYPSVCGFDHTGEPLYAGETRSEEDICCIQRIQEGILGYFRRYLELLPKGVESQSKRLDEIMLGLIHNLEIKDEDFLSLIVEDPFFNRMTNIKELI